MRMSAGGLPWPQHAVYNRVNVLHQCLRSRKGCDYVSVVIDVVARQRAAFTILQPFFADLITAHFERLGFWRYALEALGCVDVDAT
jgi:hypothetical protein